MAKKPNRSRSADSPPVPLRRRLLSFFLDWSIWGYIAYGAMYLLNYYWYTVYIDWYGRLTLPSWGWPLVIVATFELALLCRAFGHSLGERVFGLRLEEEGGLPPSWGRRFRYFL
ncbi:MAG: RDD family protein, partial [Candidatus Bipolaricaulia bacterium]